MEAASIVQALLAVVALVVGGNASKPLFAALADVVKSWHERHKLRAEGENITVDTLRDALAELRTELDDQRKRFEKRMAGIEDDYRSEIARITSDYERALKRIDELEQELDAVRGRADALEKENQRLKLCVPPKGAL